MDTLSTNFVTHAPTATGARRPFTADEFEAMVRAGILDEAERLELIGGEIVGMSAKGIRHEVLRNELALRWARSSREQIKVWSDTPLRLASGEQPEPDVLVFPAAIAPHELTGPDVLILVEVSDSCVSYDLKIKAPVYARHGVREYWVVDANRLVVHVHREPTTDGYMSVVLFQHDKLLTPRAAPELAIRLVDLKLDWQPEA